MLKDIVIKAAQVAVGAAVGCVTSDVLENYVVKPIKKVIETKKQVS